MMITYDQYKEIVTSLGYKLKPYAISDVEEPHHIDIASSSYAKSGFLVAEYVPSAKCVNHWMNNSHDLHIGPNYDASSNYDYIKEVNTSRNDADVIRDPEILKYTLTRFTKNWKTLVKDIRKQNIMEL